MAICCGEVKQESNALMQLAKGHDLPAQMKTRTSPTIMTRVSKNYDKQTLSLTKANAGPNVPLQTELFGPPSLKEVLASVKGLRWGATSSSKGLRPE